MARWSLQRLLTALLAGGFAMLCADTIWEHRGELAEHPPAWLPIVCSGLLTVLLLATVLVWRPALRTAARWTAVLPLLVGLTGWVLHNEDRLESGDLTALLPPLLAPLAFCGLAALTFLVSSTRWPESWPSVTARAEEHDA
ncbi:MAG: hypothetical protein IT204_10425 [Fimbriimonadaceae bacterium]|nr:hypothetical protein [Fimbriimonadaceae bacterium]